MLIHQMADLVVLILQNSNIMNCPICNKGGLSEKTLLCPQCDSDLSGLLLIKNVQHIYETIEKENIETKSKLIQSKKYKLIFTALFSILLTIGIVSFLWYKNEQENMYSQNNHFLNSKIDSLQTANQANNIKINELENTIEINKRKSNEIKYCVRRGDNLWKIATFFYNNPHKHTKIYEENKNVLENGLFVGDTIIIKLDN